MDDLTYDQFVRSLRSALHYLYDPVNLRRSPLIELLGLGEEFDQAAALQQTLIAAIRTLKPSTDESPQSHGWRVYDTLNLQYVRQLEREAVANQLGISERQLRREQRQAIEVLGQKLWQQTAPVRQPNSESAERLEVSPDTAQTLTRELGWLKTTEASERIPLGEAIEDVLGLAQPLAQQWQVFLYSHLPDELANLPITSLGLRNILLTLLTVAIPRSGRTPVTMTATDQKAAIQLHITSNNRHTAHTPFSTKEESVLAAAQELASFYGAALEVAPPEEAGFVATLTIPTPEQVRVVVIDDNADWLKLVQRYVSGSQYQIIGTLEPATARVLVEKVQPSLILLDVMMHNMDGWQVLGELHQEPAIAHIPVIVCTILPVDDMALSLGASAFLRKPVSQQQLLKVLDRQCRMLG
jgi:CheY-like chemotaxis protein